MDATPSAHAAALWVGLHLILLLVLSVLVVRQRRAHGVVLGDDNIPELTQAERAFAQNEADFLHEIIADLHLFKGALDATIAQNERRQQTKLQIPVLTLAGAESLGAVVGDTMRLVADDVTSLVLPRAGSGY